MWFKYPIIILAFLILTLLQVSFLPHFNIMGITPNLIFILFFVLIFFDLSSYKSLANKSKFDEYHQDIFLVILAGLILDLLGYYYFGVAIISLLLAYIFIKITFYFIKERRENYLLSYFLFIFLISFAIYNTLFYLFTHFPNIKFDVNQYVFIKLIYNLSFAFAGFFIYKFFNKTGADRQLKLFN